MREILFRGKRVDNGEWVYGYLSKSRLQGYENNTLQPSIDREESGVMITSVVITETVGQYTGLNDKNGVKIFEGDIVEYKNHIGKIVWHSTTAEFDVSIRRKNNIYLFDYIGLYLPNRYLKIIGNIHDNPESLEVE